jgi:flagellin
MSLTVGSNSGLYTLLSAMNQLESQRSLTMARLSTGKRINRASEDPAGLIALNSMNGELAAVDAALSNSQRSQSMLDVADSTMMEVGKLTADIQQLAVAAQGSDITTEEKAAYQAQIDSSIDAIDRLVNGAEYNGRKIFNGDNRIQATTNDADAIKDIKVYSRNPNVEGSVTLTASVTAGATYAYSNSASGYDLGTNLASQAVIQVTGKLGTATITLASGSTNAQVRTAINAYSGLTGVSAIAGTGNKLTYMSTEKGSESYVTVSVISGPTAFVSGGGTTKASGSDATVTVNGQSANASGTEVFYNGNGISLSFTLDDDSVASHTITVTGGGATFQLGTNTSTRAAIALGGLNSNELGRSDLGYLSSLKSGGENSLTASGSQALAIAKRANQQVAVAAGRVGSFSRYAVGATINSLNAAKESLSAAASDIGDTDYAAEIANLDRQNTLLNATISMIGIANSQANSVLNLLQMR